jgi:cell division protease FtsH
MMIHNTRPEIQEQDEGVFTILKRVAVQRDAETRTIHLIDVHKALQFFELTPKHLTVLKRQKITRLRLDEPTDDAIEALFRIPPQTQPLSLESDVKALITALMQAGDLADLKFKHAQVVWRSKRQAIYTKLALAVASVPGQAGELSSRLAADLSGQLTQPDRKGAARILVHGREAWGSHDVMLAVAKALVTEGYVLREINAAAFRTEGEGGAWVGYDPIWSGAKHGKITHEVHTCRRVVWVIRNMDLCHPSVQAVLREPMMDGFTFDKFGLDATELTEPRGPLGISRERARKPTRVDFSQTVFLFSVSHGSEWLEHPDVNTVLGPSAEERSTNLMAQLRGAERSSRGASTAVMDTDVLNLLAHHHHVVAPQTWSSLLNQAIVALPQTLDLVKERLGIEIYWTSEGDALALATIALCVHGGDMGLSHTSPEALFETIFGTLLRSRMDEDVEQDSANVSRLDVVRMVGLSIGCRKQWKTIVKELGDDPLRNLRRWRQRMHVTFDAVGVIWQLTQVRRHSVHNLSDFTGDSGLVTRLPTERLADVAGHETVKKFLADMVCWLKAPTAVTERGGKLPRGVLLHGEPGTGKTLLAKALAGEAGLPFISVAGTQLLDTQKLQRVYALAGANAPCVVHIDEAEVLGGQRGRHSHAHDAAATLWLAQLDGLGQDGVFTVLTTNRPETLDPALTRPGRIDRHFEIGTLDAAGRVSCLKGLWPLLAQTQHARVRNMTYGMSGAELAMLQREVVLRSLTQGMSKDQEVPTQWVIEEINRIRHGEANPRHINADYQQRVALHEAGHALAHQLLMPDWPLAQVSITPRNGKAGFVALGENKAPSEETPAKVRAFITVLLAGRAAEILVHGAEGASSGARSDLKRATEAAFQAVAFAGLDVQFGSASLPGFEFNGRLPAGLHERATQRTQAWVEECAQAALDLLQFRRDALEALQQALIERETLYADEVAAIANKVADKKAS